jgi:hypothetical protein
MPSSVLNKQILHSILFLLNLKLPRCVFGYRCIFLGYSTVKVTGFSLLHCIAFLFSADAIFFEDSPYFTSKEEMVLPPLFPRKIVVFLETLILGT